MATWTARNVFRGREDSSCDSRGSSPAPSTPPSTPSPWSEDTDLLTTPGDPMDDSGFHEWLEVQLGATGEMSVVERLQYLLDTGQFADLNVRVGQGNNVAVFKAHRLLVSTASQPLYRLVHQVNPHPGPNEITTIRVTDMKPSDFQHILKYIYTDNIDCKNISVAFELLRASRKWGLAGLGIKSLTFLEEFIDNFEPATDEAKSNLFDLLVLSEDTLGEMSDKCWQKLLKNAEDLVPCEGFLKLDKKMAQKVICHKDMKLENQLRLFEAIRDWGLRYVEKNNLKLSQLGDVVEELLKAVDFEKISDADFLSTVLTSECLGKAEVIAFFMTHGLEIPRNLDFNNNKQLPFWLCLCATSDQEKGSRAGRNASKHTNNLSTVNEALSKICSLTQNGSVLEFNKVCRFRKGYRCPVKEIYQEHELRFRVDKNIKLLGVGFGFLFSATDMGINVHCQGPWETRQWTDITQSYCRVSGEKQETADVRLMFLHPVRIEANQSYKVVVKTVRMSQGSSEVELWGGTGGMYCVETEDAEFYFIKAAVDPEKKVEESDGDTKPGVIHELLYQLDTDEPEQPAQSIPRRRRPETQEEDQSSTQRRRQRPDTLTVPETPSQRKRSPPSDDYKTPEAPPLSRRRESNDISPSYSSSQKTSVDEYLPTSFSTNRWRMNRRRDDDETEKKKPPEEYKPSSFSTNRWRTRPKEEDETEKKKSTDEYVPSSFATNRWRTTRGKEEDKSEGRKTSTDDRWRPRPVQEEKKDTPFGNRVRAKPEESQSLNSHPFVRRRDSKDTTEIPFYMRRTSTQADDSKGTSTGLSRSRYGVGSSASTTDDSRSSRYFKPDGSTSATTSLRPSGTSSLLSSRYGRDSTFSRPRESSLSRFGSSSSYLSRYDNANSTDSPYSSSSVDSTNKYSSSSTMTPSDSRYKSLSGKYGADTASRPSKYSVDSTNTAGASSRYGKDYGSTTSRYGTDSITSSSKYGTDSAAKPPRYGADSGTSSSKYGAEASTGAGSRYSTPARQLRRYGTSTTSSGSNLAALGGGKREGFHRYGSTRTAGSAGNLNALSSRPDTTTSTSRYRTTTGAGDTTLGTSRYSGAATTRYGSSAGTGSSSLSTRYGSPAPTGSSAGRSGTTYSGLSAGKYGTSSGGGGSKYSSAGQYSSAPPTRVTGRGAGLSSYGNTSRYGSPAPASSRYSRAGR